MIIGRWNMIRSRIVKVTASHNIAPGRSSTAIISSRNMICCHIVKIVTASHNIAPGSSSAAIIGSRNMMTIMMPTTGVKKATASHGIVCGSSSTEINAKSNMMPATVAKRLPLAMTIFQVQAAAPTSTRQSKESNTFTSQWTQTAAAKCMWHTIPQ